MDKQKAETAAKWWADLLRTRPSHDNGDSMQSAMMNMLKSKSSKISEESISKFESALKDKLKNTSGYLFISVDYGPDIILSESLKDAEIDQYMALPVKTKMWFDENSVKVSLGYRAPINLIWSSNNPNEQER